MLRYIQIYIIEYINRSADNIIIIIRFIVIIRIWIREIDDPAVIIDTVIRNIYIKWIYS